MTLLEEINSTPHNNLGHSNCLSVKSFFVNVKAGNEKKYEIIKMGPKSKKYDVYIYNLVYVYINYI